LTVVKIPKLEETNIVIIALTFELKKKINMLNTVWFKKKFKTEIDIYENMNFFFLFNLFI